MITQLIPKEILQNVKYEEQARELKRLWKTKPKIIPVVIVALSTTSKMLPKKMDWTRDSHCRLAEI